MPRTQHTVASERAWLIEQLGITSDTAERLQAVLRDCAMQGAELDKLKVGVHNSFVVQLRDPEVKATRDAARVEQLGDLKVGDRVTGLKGVRPKYLSTLQGTVVEVFAAEAVVEVDRFGGGSITEGYNLWIDHRVERYVRGKSETTGGRIRVPLSMIEVGGTDHVQKGR